MQFCKFEPHFATALQFLIPDLYSFANFTSTLQAICKCDSLFAIVELLSQAICKLNPPFQSNLQVEPIFGKRFASVGSRFIRICNFQHPFPRSFHFLTPVLQDLCSIQGLIKAVLHCSHHFPKKLSRLKSLSQELSTFYSPSTRSFHPLSPFPTNFALLICPEDAVPHFSPLRSQEHLTFKTLFQELCTFGTKSALFQRTQHPESIPFYH